MNGSLVKWVAPRGYGFIACDDLDGDIFVHAQSLKHSGIAEVQVGDIYLFELWENKKLDQVEANFMVRVSKGTGATYSTERVPSEPFNCHKPAWERYFDYRVRDQQSHGGD